MTTEKNTAPVREPYDAMGPVDAPNPPTARAPLADVQPGGRVRLGDRPTIEMRARELLASAYADTGAPALLVDEVRSGKHDTASDNAALRAIVTALAAQPSPGGQGGLNYERMFVDACAALAEVSRELGCDPEQGGAEPILSAIAELREALAARQPVGDQHSDDLAVDAFAAAMKAKMAEARAKGRGGWEDPAQCTAEDLSRMLRDHVEKGDPRDVANFCMMLHQRGEAIAARQPVDEVSVKKEDANNYCLILRALGMEEEGDPVAEVQALIEARDRQPVGEPDAYLVQTVKDDEAWEHRWYVPRWGDPNPSALDGKVYEIRGRKHPELGTYRVKPFYAAPLAQVVGHGPVTVEAVATVRRWSNGDRYIDWLTEGGIADLEVGDVLMVSDRAITDEDGSGEVYTTPPAQAVDLGAVREALQAAEGLATICASVDGYSREEVAASGRAMKRQFADVLAKVDSQAVGK